MFELIGFIIAHFSAAPFITIAVDTEVYTNRRNTQEINCSAITCVGCQDRSTSWNYCLL